ncbi:MULTISPECIES: acyltransferase [unclassified Mesorhizobium]|uniref:acyltransferase family protein n=1 Tax=unclassified Mesorhizobium TaxID=325217 RepID=UPI0003CF8E12|nr:acyltransferase [Mesorhizobium sp. LSJC265A00]ESX09235.1 acyltransferase [Mesorhizobium sp. LSJC265A00]
MATIDQGAIFAVRSAKAVARPAEDRIAGFDGVRAIAVLMVFISHKTTLPHHDSYGSVGVWLFLVLSGMLISSILSEMRAKVEAGVQSTWRSMGDFYLRRSLRIFPLYYACLGVFALGSLFTSFVGFSRVEATIYALYGTNIYIEMTPTGAHGHFGHLWSLSAEEQFYLLLAPILLFTPRKYLLRICIGFMLAGAARLAWLVSVNTHPNAIHVDPLIAFGMLGVGGFLASLKNFKPPAWLVSAQSQAAAGLALIAIPLVFGYFRDAWNVFGPLTCTVAGLFLFQIARNQQTPVVAFLNLWPLRSLGRVSYAFYILHQFVHFYDLTAVLHKLHLEIDAPASVQLALELFITIALATLSWHFFERPLLRLGARLTAREGTEASSATAALSPGRQRAT